MNDRRLELSVKFIEMGRALMKEGHESKSISISQAGTGLIAIGGLLLDDENLKLFGEMCGLFASKMILDNMEKDNHEYTTYLRHKSSNETYEDFIKRINKLREDNGHSPIG